MFSVKKSLEDAGFKAIADESDHVICCIPLDKLISEADRCSELMGPDYIVQASYSPGHDVGSLFIAHKDEFCDCDEPHEPQQSN